MQRLGPRYHLLLVGSSMPAVVPDNVSVIDGFCPAATVARLMASADALIHAGDQETFGLVILEAMACGIPVLAVAAGAFEEIVAEDCGLLCAPNNPQAMANAVRELFSRGCLKLGQQARQHVERRYSWTAWSTACSVITTRCSVTRGKEWPMADSLNDRAVLLVLHDVAPSTWRVIGHLSRRSTQWVAYR